MRGALVLVAALLWLSAPTSAQTMPDWGRPYTPAEVRTLQGTVARLAREKGIREALLAQVARAVGQKSGIRPFSAVITIVERKAEEAKVLKNQIAELERQLVVMSEAGLRDPAAAAVARADRAIDEGRLDDAERALAELDDLRRSAYAAARSGWLAAIQSRAAIAELTLNYDKASSLKLAAADEIGRHQEHDRFTRWQLTVDAGQAQYEKAAISSDVRPLREAVRIYRTLALPIAPRSSMPEQWASTQYGLGAALTRLGERQLETTSLIEAVGAFEATLEVWSRERTPELWASSLNSEAVILFELGRRSREPRALERALAMYAQVEQVRTREADPVGWGRVELNRGNALFLLGHLRADPQQVREAVASFERALETFEPDREPFDWSTAQNSLAIAEIELAELTKDPNYIESAVRHIRSVLSVFTRARWPLDWAREHYNLGNAWSVRGEMQRDPSALRQAITSYSASLEIYDREADPGAWAASQRNLGVAWQQLDGMEPSMAARNEALKAASAAQQVYDRSSFPAEWAEIEFNVASLFRNRAKRDGACGDARQSEEHLANAIKAFPAKGGVAKADRKQLADDRALVGRLCH